MATRWRISEAELKAKRRRRQAAARRRRPSASATSACRCRVEFAAAGLRVTGFDLSAEKVDAVNRGRVLHQGRARRSGWRRSSSAGRLRASRDFDGLAECDAVIICVPTPLSKTKDPDLSMVVDAAQGHRGAPAAGQLVVLESTTYPGHDRGADPAPADASGASRWGSRSSWPSRPSAWIPATPRYNTRNTPKIIGGVTPACTRVAQALYAQAIDTVIPVSSTRAAEMVKLLENTFRSVNIGLVNEVALMCERLGWTSGR